MMATWAGTAPCTRNCWSRSVLIESDFQDLRFFGVNKAFDLLDVLVSVLLNLLLGARLVVLGDLFQLLDFGKGLGARVPNRNAPLFAQLVHHLDQVFAPFFRERW